jgi:inorganic pyrophosphatase
MSSATPYARLSAVVRPGLLRAVIEAPKGSRNKFKYDDQLGLFTLDRVLPLGFAFPFDFGFIPSTRAEDGDPLDVLVFLEEPVFPGCVLPVRPLGVLEAEQTRGGRTVRNDRLLAVLDSPHNPARQQTLADLEPGRIDAVEHFFISYNHWVGRVFKILSRQGPEQAWKLVEKAVRLRETERTAEKPRKSSA